MPNRGHQSSGGDGSVLDEVEGPCLVGVKDDVLLTQHLVTQVGVTGQQATWSLKQPTGRKVTPGSYRGQTGSDRVKRGQTGVTKGSDWGQTGATQGSYRVTQGHTGVTRGHTGSNRVRRGL